MIEAIVFDMDGILFDTERLSVESWVEVAGQMGLGDIDKGVYGCIGLNRTDCRIFLKETYGEDFPYEYFREQTAAVFQQKVDKDGLPVMKGAQELLLWLQEKGMKVALASSTNTRKVESHLQLAGFTGFFQAVIGGDMVEHSKPLPDIYWKACQLLQADPAGTVAVEDSPNGIRSAYAAGMLPVMVPDLVQPDPEIANMLYQRCDSLFAVRDFLEKKLKEGEVRLYSDMIGGNT
nr:HAD family phosphatase [uncultured Eisenbergiella sp.]